MRGTRVPPLSDAEAAAFWAQTQRLPSGCLEWTGQQNGPKPLSYGLFTFYRAGRKVRLMAHRVALALANDGDGVFACHHCDNPPCVEPSHLYWGDAQSNSADMIRRGRSGAPLGSIRSDTTRRWIADLRARGGEAATVTSDEYAGWMADRSADADAIVSRIVSRARRNDFLDIELLA